MEEIIGKFKGEPVLAHAYLSCGYQDGGHIVLYLSTLAVPSRHFTGEGTPFFRRWQGGYRAQGEPVSRHPELESFQEWQEKNSAAIRRFEEKAAEAAEKLPLKSYTEVETREL